MPKYLLSFTLYFSLAQICFASVDAHMHLFSPQNGVDIPISGKDIIEQLDLANIERAVVISGGYWFSDRSKAGNENNYVAGEVAKYSPRLVGLCGIRPTEDWAVSEVERCVKVLRLQGIKIHPQQNQLNLTDKITLEKLDAVFKKAEEFNVPVLFDSVGWEEKEVFSFLGLVFGHPKLRVILAHSFLHQFRDLAILATLYKAYPDLPRNVFVDLSAIQVVYVGSPEEESLLWHLRQIGIGNILFGSDYPVFGSKVSYDAFINLKFTSDEKRRILQENALSLYKF